LKQGVAQFGWIDGKEWTPVGKVEKGLKGWEGHRRTSGKEVRGWKGKRVRPC